MGQIECVPNWDTLQNWRMTKMRPKLGRIGNKKGEVRALGRTSHVGKGELTWCCTQIHIHRSVLE